MLQVLPGEKRPNYSRAVSLISMCAGIRIFRGERSGVDVSDFNAEWRMRNGE